eukprot:TRINITY_DN11519_c0_g1_i2.p1 TRINITY_DN11519_c0_g1~~TRINITY_DN11519_c0_g1_i2.p1  ORF type:complete len:2103 (+),score=364.03 TRINITY_DN11519_c0_g1_i2:537-6311(+)
MFDTNDDGLLSAENVHQLLEYALSREEEKYLPSGEDIAEKDQRRLQRISDIKQELLSTSSQVSFDRFYDWAAHNMDSLNNLLCTFQIVPSPDRERAICEEILSRHPSLQEGSTWYCISHKWLQVWKAHAEWTGPSPGRRKPSVAAAAAGAALSSSVAGLESLRERHWDRVYSGDSGIISLPIDDGLQPPDEGRSDELFLNELSSHHTLSARPPEIDNSDLEGEHKGELKMNLVEHLDYELIPEEMWFRLVEWYGGGPALPRKVICMGQDNQSQVELYPPLVLVVVAGKDGQPLPQFSRRFFISRQSTLAETLSMLAEKLLKPPDRSRLWHRSKGEQWRLVEQSQLALVMDEFLEGKVWDAGAFLLETQAESNEWPRDQLANGGALAASEEAAEAEREAESTPFVEGSDLTRHFEVGDRVEAMSAVTSHWMRGTIVDVVLRDHGSTPSQVKVHYDSTVYKCDEWISTSSDRLAAFGTHTAEGGKAADGDMPIPERGATGLQNLGNTCFMNATIQCMVNTPLVREYFLSSQYLRDVNEKGTSGCKGKLAQEFGQVTNDIWAGKSSVISPRNLKRTIDQFAPQFAGYEQHDAQELLAFVLEGLHEDLNRSQGSSTGSRIASTLRKEQGTPKLFSNSKPMLGRGGRENASPKRAKYVWQRDRPDTDGGARSLGGAAPADESSVSSDAHSNEVVGLGLDWADRTQNSLLGGQENSMWAAAPENDHSGGTMEDEDSHTLDDGLDSSHFSPTDSRPEEHLRGSSLDSRTTHSGQAPVRQRPGSSRGPARPSESAEATQSGREASPGVVEEQMPGTSISSPGLGQTVPPTLAQAEAQSEDELPVPAEPSARTDLTSVGTIMLLPPCNGDWSTDQGVVQNDGVQGCVENPAEGSDSPEQGPSHESIVDVGGGSSGENQTAPNSAHAASPTKLEARKSETSAKRGFVSSRWWNFAWRRSRGALDVPKDGSCEMQSDSSLALKEAGASGAVRDAIPEASSFPGLGRASPSPTPSCASSTPLIAAVQNQQQSQTPPNPETTPEEPTNPVVVAGGLVGGRSGTKTPSGSAGAAVVAARRGDDGTMSEDGMSSNTFNESEDFVPELLTPSTRRGRSIFNWRRTRKGEDEHGPGSPRRRPKTPPTMMPLREGDETYDDPPRPESAEAAGVTREVMPANEVAAGTGPVKSYLPWRGTLRSREGSLERGPGDEAEQVQAKDAGPGWAGRTQPKSGDSLLPAFLRRGRSRETKHGRAPAPRAPPVPHQGDLPVADGIGKAESNLSDGEVTGLGSDSEAALAPGASEAALPPAPGDAKAASDRAAYTPSGGMAFPFFRSPWNRQPARSAPASRGQRAAGPKTKEAAGNPDAASPQDFSSQVQEQQVAPVVDASNEGGGHVGGPTQPVQSTNPSLQNQQDKEKETEENEDNLPDEEKAALNWERYRVQNRSLIVDVFEGQLRSQLTCRNCGNASSTFEPFRYLSVPIPSNHTDRYALRVVFFRMPASPSDRPELTRFTVTVPKSSNVKRVEMALSSRLPVPMSSVLLAEVYRSRIHRYLDPNLPLSDVRAEDQLFAFEVMQKAQDLLDYQEQLAPSRMKKERIEEPSKQPRVLMIQAVHRRVVDVCRSDGRTWSQRREVFGLPFVMSAASSWTYATLHEMLMIHATRFLNTRTDKTPEERQVPFVARIVNASGTACGACDRRNCTGCLLPKGSAKLRLRAGLLTGAASTAKIFLALDWVDSSMYDQEYVDSVVDDASTPQAEDEPESNEPRNAAFVPLAACMDSFTEVEHMQVESGNGVKCEKCNKTVDAVKKIEIWREPDVLVLHIKRFHFSGEHFEKIATSVEVPPRDLDIRPWIVGPTGLSLTTYDLYGVACHRGGMSGGHYTSYCMNEGGKEPTWLKFNDDTVTRVNLQQELPEINKQCYVLFYRKRAFSSSNLINYLSL